MGIFSLRGFKQRKNSPVVSGRLPWGLLIATILILFAYSPMTAEAFQYIGNGPNDLGNTINVTGNPAYFGLEGSFAHDYTNNGTISIASGSWLTGDVLNNSGSGILEISSGGFLELYQTLNNDGVLSNSGGVVIQDTWNHNAGATYSGNGVIRIQGTQLNNTSDNAFAIDTLDFTSGSFINNGAGAVSIGTVDIRFGVYYGTIQGNAISLATANVEGPLAINSVITGAGSLTKTGGGTLTLSEANTYSGGTIINAGTVSIGNDGNLGNAAGALTFGGGTLRVTSGFTLNRSVTLNAGGGTFDTNGNSLTLSGNMTGTGFLTKIGLGTLILSGTNNYSGGTTVTAGILQGDTTSLQGGITNNSQVTFNQNTNGTYAGVISGTGSLTKEGTGTVILTGTNNYSGGTTVTAGILQGDTTSLQGSVANNSQVVFNQGAAGTYTGNMTGTGTLTKTGAGTLTLSGTNTYTDTTTIDAGSLSVNGSITSPVTIGAAGTLMGNGMITGDVTNSGTLAPGNSIGTITVNGDYTQNIGSTYQVEVNAAGQSDRLVVTGTATLNDGTVSVLAESGNYKMSTLYTILTAAGGVTGTYSGVTSNLAFLTPSLSYDANDVYLTLTRNTTGFADVASTPNQYAVALGLDRASPYALGDMSEIMNNLLGLSAQGGRSAYDQMGGLSHVSLEEATFFSFNRYVNILSGRMAGFNTGGMSLAGAENILLAFNEDKGSDAGNMLVAAIRSAKGEEASPWGLWAKGYGNMGDRLGDDIATKYDYRGGGLIVGFDGKMSERLLLGAAVGYSYTKVDMNDLDEDSKVASYQGSLYGAYNIDPWYVNGLIAYGYNRYDTTRDITFGDISRTARADYSGHSLSGYVETGYQITTEAVNIIPLASIQAGSLWRNAFTERDAGALNLIADSDRTSSFIGSLGVKLRKEYRIQNGSIIPELRCKWLHEFADSDYTLNASFTGYPVSTFSVRGDRAQRDSAAVGAGVNWEMNKSFALALTYDATLSGDRTEHGGTAGIRYRW